MDVVSSDLAALMADGDTAYDLVEFVGNFFPMEAYWRVSSPLHV